VTAIADEITTVEVLLLVTVGHYHELGYNVLHFYVISPYTVYMANKDD